MFSFVAAKVVIIQTDNNRFFLSVHREKSINMLQSQCLSAYLLITILPRRMKKSVISSCRFIILC